MNGGRGKTVLKALYFILTFLLGGLLAVMLPNWLLYENVANGVAEALAEERYTGSILPLSGYFDVKPAFKTVVSEGKGMVLFPSAFARETPDETTGQAKQTIFLSYTGYIYGVKDDYRTAAKENNRATVVATDVSGRTTDYPILNYDLDGDGISDSNATIQEKGFLCLEFDRETFGSLSKIDFYDCDGNLYLSFGMSLIYSEQFFEDAASFAEEYNAGTMDETRFAEADAEFRSKSPDYLIGSVDEYRPKSVTVSCVLVVCYFLLVYLIYDFTLGRRFVLRGIKWLIGKIFRVDFGKKEREKSEREAEEILLGQDYYCKVTCSLDLEAVPDFRESVLVRYSDPDLGEIEFQLLPAEGYRAAARVHAGVYRNAWIEMNRSYEAEDLPDRLAVEGFQMELKIKIRERAGNQH